MNEFQVRNLAPLYQSFEVHHETDKHKLIFEEVCFSPNKNTIIEEFKKTTIKDDFLFTRWTSET
jgi:hypothetical protein